MTKKAPKVPVIHAAGGVLYHRDDSGTVTIAVVHRPRYNDWSLPKGKVDPGESAAVTAVREIAEETGYACELENHLATVEYPLSNKSRKLVHYWAARCTDGVFSANSEVDELRWLHTKDAEILVSYSLDRRVIAAFSNSSPIDSKIALVRHARAGKRSGWIGDDTLRPLDKDGRIQAQFLSPLLRSYGVGDIYSADRVRCTQTLSPLADELGLEIQLDQHVSDEAVIKDVDFAAKHILELSRPGTTTVICSQGSAIPAILEYWSDSADLLLHNVECKKGSVWILGLSQGKIVTADYTATALPLL